MSALHAEYPAEDIVLDECSPGISPYVTAEIPIDATRNWASAVQLWNLALDPSGGPYEGDWGCPGCTGVVTVNEQNGTPSLGLNYYQYGQTTKYVEPGAVRIFSTRLVPDGYGVTRGRGRRRVRQSRRLEGLGGLQQRGPARAAGHPLAAALPELGSPRACHGHVDLALSGCWRAGRDGSHLASPREATYAYSGPAAWRHC